MKIRGTLAVAISLSCIAFGACTTQPVRVNCGNRLTPINIPALGDPRSSGTTALPSARRPRTEPQEKARHGK